MEFGVRRMRRIGYAILGATFTFLSHALGAALTHIVVLSLVERRPTTILASEGFATWLGGTAGADLRSSVRDLTTYLTSQRAVTLDSIMDSA